MKLEKLNINGKKKSKEEQEQHCDSCQDGEIFLEEKYVKTQKYQSPAEEKMCGSCSTKYKIPREEANKVINEDCNECPHIGETECMNTDNEYLCYGNEEKLFHIEFEKLVAEVGKMDLAYTQKVQEFEETGKCNDHSWIKSNPFRTAEGRFQINSCKICRVGKLDYKGKLYEDNLMNLLNFLAHTGIEAEKRMKRKEIEMSTLLVTVSEPKKVSLAKLFCTKLQKVLPIDLPKFDLSKAFIGIKKPKMEGLNKEFGFI